MKVPKPMMIQPNRNCSLHKFVREFFLKNYILSSNVFFFTLKKALIVIIFYIFLFFIVSCTILLHIFYICTTLVYVFSWLHPRIFQVHNFFSFKILFDLHPLPHLVWRLILKFLGLLHSSHDWLINFYIVIFSWKGFQVWLTKQVMKFTVYNIAMNSKG